MGVFNRKRAIILAFFIIIANCSRIQPIIPQGNDFYGKPFLEEIKNIKNYYKKGDKKNALSLLVNMDSKKLLPEEKALVKNLTGVIYFSNSDFNKAISNFKEALELSTQDKALISQIHLNLASTYYKTGDSIQSLNYLSLVDDKILTLEESRKYNQLNYIFAKKENNNKKILDSLITYLGSFKTIMEMKEDQLCPELENVFFKLEQTERDNILKNFESEKELISLPYLAFIEMENQYYLGNKDKSYELINWIKEKYAKNIEINKLVDDFQIKLENFSKININSIGLVLPLTGKKKKYAEQTMEGVNTALQTLFKKNQEGEKNIPIVHIRDSMGNGIVGAFAVKELVEKHYVSILIGGLFSDEALKEYQEAKKRGAFFISLSPIYLPKEEKDHLLLEIPGSVESQVDRAFSDDVLNKFGKKIALMIPLDERGGAYLQEAWRQAELRGVEITNVQRYAKDATDYREPIKKILGLHFKRERQEEQDFLNKIYSLAENQSIKRIQTLMPIIDFDWIYMPGFPTEAQYLIPTFKYFDAPSLTFIGSPSWRSNTLTRISQNDPLYFIGNEINQSVVDFRKSFFGQSKKWPGLVEVISYDAMKVVADLLAEGQQFESRIEFEKFIRNKSEIVGVESNWKFDGSVWMKTMTALKFHKDKIQGAFDNKDSLDIKLQENVL